MSYVHYLTRPEHILASYHPSLTRQRKIRQFALAVPSMLELVSMFPGCTGAVQTRRAGPEYLLKFLACCTFEHGFHLLIFLHQEGKPTPFTRNHRSPAVTVNLCRLRGHNNLHMSDRRNSLHNLMPWMIWGVLSLVGVLRLRYRFTGSTNGTFINYRKPRAHDWGVWLLGGSYRFWEFWRKFLNPTAFPFMVPYMRVFGIAHITTRAYARLRPAGQRLREHYSRFISITALASCVAE